MAQAMITLNNVTLQRGNKERYYHPKSGIIVRKPSSKQAQNRWAWCIQLILLYLFGKLIKIIKSLWKSVWRHNKLTLHEMEQINYHDKTIQA